MQTKRWLRASGSKTLQPLQARWPIQKSRWLKNWAAVTAARSLGKNTALSSAGLGPVSMCCAHSPRRQEGLVEVRKATIFCHTQLHGDNEGPLGSQAGCNVGVLPPATGSLRPTMIKVRRWRKMVKIIIGPKDVVLWFTSFWVRRGIKDCSKRSVRPNLD